AVDVLVMGALAATIALLTGALLHPALRGLESSRALALHLGLVGGALCGWYLWQGAAELYAEGRVAGSLAMAAMPLGFGGVVYFNARYWLRGVEVGVEYRLPGWALGLGSGLVLVTVGAVAHGTRHTGGEGALEDDPS